MDFYQGDNLLSMGHYPEEIGINCGEENRKMV